MIQTRSPDNSTNGCGCGGQPIPRTSPRDGGTQGRNKLELGVTFVNFNVYGLATADQHQKDLFDYLLDVPRLLGAPFMPRGTNKRHILQDFEGIIRPGEMLLVLGRPGSGCSTFLKTMAGYVNGLDIGKQSQIHYGGIPYSHFHHHFQGERAYVGELDVHFPELTLAQTLDFAAAARPTHANDGAGHKMALQFGLGAALNTPVGDALIRGLSGGEKRRASIAEACLGGAQFQCWDNSTRGLDSSTARRFVGFLRQSTRVQRTSAALSIYQASDEIYQEFDKVILLYEGRQIFYGPTSDAINYFREMGFVKPEGVTSPDFLTSLTSPGESQFYVAGDMSQMPRSPEQFAETWNRSKQAERVRDEIASFQSQLLNAQSPGGNAIPNRPDLRACTFPLTIAQQVLLCTRRTIWRMRQKASSDITAVMANTILGLIIGSVYYGQDETTNSLQSRSILLFFALILNAFAPAMEVILVWAQRPIVEKHHRYAFYQPCAERASAFICDIPVKAMLCFGIHIPLYFMSNLRRSAGAFFLYWLFMFVNLVAMSMLFRMLGSVSRTSYQTFVPVSFVILLSIIYMGFIVPPESMVPWFGWFWRINPLAYTYENLMLNEMHGRTFPCSMMIPAGPYYEDVPESEKICPVVGSQVGEPFVQGTLYLSLKYSYTIEHLWRNFGILLAMLVVFSVGHFVAAQLLISQPSRGEVLVFNRRRGLGRKDQMRDEEKGSDKTQLVDSPPRPNLSHRSLEETHTNAEISDDGACLYWNNIHFNINGRDILQDSHGWLQPGTLTVLMGVTGAGKTSLLNVLAGRITSGTTTGDISIGGRPLSSSYQRRLGYVQQEDIHMATATVRESLEFSAFLRQPSSKSQKDKMAFIDEVLDLMDMREYEHAIVGIPGEGLNLEQRKRLTIAVEIVAQPELVLLVDEPTSGLDSQTAWSICVLLRKLASKGQSIICTIHQPSLQLFTMFDRVLLLGENGKTLYFGDIGSKASTLVDYFESNGAPLCQPGTNVAEWMIEITNINGKLNNSGNCEGFTDWAAKWDNSIERCRVLSHLTTLKETHSQTSQLVNGPEEAYAASIFQQIKLLSKRALLEQWRNPFSLLVKLVVFVGNALLNGFSFFDQSLDIQGITSLLFSIFFSTYLFSYIVQMAVPTMHRGRELFRAREGISKTYSWASFLVAYISVEIFWDTLIGVMVFAAWYYPTGLSHNSTSHFGTANRGSLTFALVWLFMLWASTLSQGLALLIQEPEVAMQIGILLYWLALVFCGVLVSPKDLPQFWSFMYRVSPLTYLLEGLAVAGLSGAQVRCSAIELLDIPFDSELRTNSSDSGASPSTCYEYLLPYVGTFSGYVANPSATSMCKFCPVSSVNTLLEEFGMDVSHAWRDAGLLLCYVLFNIVTALGLFRAVRAWRR